jgi:hypothetical protein
VARPAPGMRRPAAADFEAKLASPDTGIEFFFLV